MLDVSLPAAALGGLISFLSPCVLPLVPPYLSFLAGTTVSELNAGQDRQVRQRAVRAALLFVAGFTTVFVILGATASVVGQVIRQHLMLLSTVAGVAIIVMGLHFLGVFRIGMLYREARLQVGRPAGAWGAYVMGLAFAFGWTPCIGPILSVVLTTAATQDTLARGVGLLIAYSLGLGVPFVAAGLGLGRLASVFGWVKRHFRLLNLVSGSFLVVFGLLLFTNNLGDVSLAIQNFLEDIGLDGLANI
jgi:cytochrome c-type biogenesis protein